MESPILFLVFNRPDTTIKVFEAIRAAKPPRLYIAADGPRINYEGEAERCQEVRKIATAVDWLCEVKILFRNENLGCKLGVSGGINWFFENEEEGIILEDDVLPIPSFFPYCDELLERYRNDDRVGVISGCNLIAKRLAPKESYFFSHYNHVWGWASWRRAWQRYDIAMSTWPEWRDYGGLTSLSNGNTLFETYWAGIFEKTFRGGIDTWDYQWVFTCWYYGMITALPAHNQTNNLGFGHPNAVHTKDNAPDYIKESIPKPLTFPLWHPVNIERLSEADVLIDRYVFGIIKKASAKEKIRRLIDKFLKKI
ncbi:MAG: hypothetical protein LAC69_03705 [Chlorobium sp.]|jgi:hypothetical protein|nr:hypothetical protein [Chlorobium sp.]